MEIPKDKLEAALAALEAERQARMEARLSAPDYDPVLIWTHPAHDRGLIIRKHVANNPRDAGRDFITLAWTGDGAAAMVPDLTTPTSLRAWAAKEAELAAAEAAARQASTERPPREAESADDKPLH
jgi:hypothetical protein